MNSAATRFLFLVLVLQFHEVINYELTKSSWADLEIANKIAGGMPYKDFIIDIYELRRNATQLDNKKTYAYTPAAELDHRSATCRQNVLSGNYEVVFSIRFWNARLQNDVVSYLQKEVNPDIRNSDVSVIHFDKVMLTSSFSSKLYQINSEWQNYRKNQVVRFKLICLSQQNCDQTVKLLHSNPGLFDHLRLQLSVSSKTSRTRAARITAKVINQGKFLSELIQRFPNNNDLLLTAEDANRLISETAANVALEIVDDTGLVSPKSAIYSELERILIQSQVVSSQMDKALWNSVFWMEENYRPDRTSKQIMDVYSKSDDESKNMIKDYLTTNDKSEKDAKTGISLGIFDTTIGFNFNDGFQRQSNTNKQWEKEEMLKTLKEAKGHVEWVGDRFEPKSMRLSRLNMAVIRQNTEFKEVETSITYATAGLSMDVVIDEELEAREDQLTVLDSKVKKLMTVQDQHVNYIANLNVKVGKIEGMTKNVPEKIQKLESSLKEDRANAQTMIEKLLAKQSVSEANITSLSSKKIEITCRNGTTPNSPFASGWECCSGRGDNHYLGAVNLECGPDEYLMKFNLQSHGFHHLSLHYRCCKFDLK